MTPVADALRGMRLIHVRFCWHCTCHEGGRCWRYLVPVRAWHTCVRWRDRHAGTD